MSQRKEVSALGVAGTRSARRGCRWALSQPGVGSWEMWPAHHVHCHCFLLPHACILREQGWADWESLLNVTACPAGSLPLSIKDDSCSLWQPFPVGQLFCLTDQFCSHWVGRTSFHLSCSSQVWAGSKQQKGTLVNTGKINHWLFA